MANPSDDSQLHLQLVTLVHRHPCLWDRRHSGYRHFNVSEPAWEEIAREMGRGLTVTDLKTRWRILRITYGRNLRNNRTDLFLFKEMSFLEPFMMKRRTPRKVTREEDSRVVEANRREESIVISDEEYDYVGFDGGSSDGELEKVESPVGQEDQNDEVGDERYILVDIRNDDAMFLLSVLPNMRQMSADQKNKFKVSLLQASDQILKHVDP